MFIKFLSLLILTATVINAADDSATLNFPPSSFQSPVRRPRIDCSQASELLKRCCDQLERLNKEGIETPATQTFEDIKLRFTSLKSDLFDPEISLPNPNCK